MKRKLDIVMRTEWKAPREGEDMVKVLTMPNIPKPLHLVNPRNILGRDTWDRMRRACYAKTEDTCEVCGYKPEFRRDRHAHELYDIDYLKGESVFVRAVCLCSRHHVAPGVHTGRALTLYKKHDVYMSGETILNGLEDMFKLVNDYNKAHPNDEPLRFFAAMLGFLDEPELEEPLLNLIDKYDVKFWRAPGEDEKAAEWGDWHLVIGRQTYYTPYLDYEAWEEAMKKNNSDNKAIVKSTLDEESERIAKEIEEALKSS